jgi:hypothetical protein
VEGRGTYAIVLAPASAFVQFSAFYRPGSLFFHFWRFRLTQKQQSRRRVTDICSALCSPHLKEQSLGYRAVPCPAI